MSRDKRVEELDELEEELKQIQWDNGIMKKEQLIVNSSDDAIICRSTAGHKSRQRSNGN